MPQARRSAPSWQWEQRRGEHRFVDGARRTHRFTTTMLRQAPRTTRSAVRLLTGLKPSQKPARPNARFLHKRHPLFDSPLVLQNPIPAASTLTSTSRPWTRPFASTSRNSVRHPRSGDHRRATISITQPLRAGTTDDDDLPRKGRKANPFLPFQASSFLDAFVTTIVGVGISELYKHEGVVDLN